MGQDDVRHLRTRPRLKVFQPVEMRGPAGTVRGHLLDLSGGGALAHCADPPAVGATLVLVLGDVEHLAQVVWREGRRFGVAFHFRIGDAEIDRVIGAETVRQSAAISR